MGDELRGAELKLQRAGQQLTELGAATRAFVATKPFGVIQARDVATEKLGVLFDQKADIDPLISLVTGEMVGNLRSALDYLVYAVVVKATGAPPRGTKTQFPIYDTEKGYGSKRGEALLLQDVPQPVKDAIRACQPFATGEGHSSPLWHLRLLSNRDKHHNILIAAAAMIDPALRLHPEFAEVFIHAGNKPLKPYTSLFSATLTPSPLPFLEREGKIELNVQFRLYLTFESPEPLQGLEIPKALVSINQRVADVVNQVRGVAGL